MVVRPPFEKPCSRRALSKSTCFPVCCILYDHPFVLLCIVSCISYFVCCMLYDPCMFILYFLCFSTCPSRIVCCMITLSFAHVHRKEVTAAGCRTPQRPIFTEQKGRHRLNGYLAQRVPSLFLASSFRMCLHCEVLKVYFPGGLGTH